MSRFHGQTDNPIDPFGFDENMDSFPTHSAPNLPDDTFGQLLQQWISDSQAQFPTQMAVQQPTAQQCPSYYLPAVEDAPYGGHRGLPNAPFPTHQGPSSMSAPWPPSNDPYLYQDWQLEGSGLAYSGEDGTVAPPNTANGSPQPSTQGAGNAHSQTAEWTQNVSKRAIKRAAFEAMNVEFGIDFRRKGEVRYIDGQLHVKVRDNFKPAVYHEELRAEYIAKAPPTLYVHPPKRGRDALDVTSFHESHRTWGFGSRDVRPEICFQWLPTNDRITPVPGPMMHNGRIVIDIEHHPVRDWPIPFCLSSDVEGGRLEAMSRENGGRITKRDFRARMPPKVLKRDGKWKDLIGETALGMRRIRFRDQASLIAQDPRDGSLEKKKSLIQCIPAEVMNQILVDNSVRCWRDLTKQEITFINTVNAGQHLNKAGSKRLTDEVRGDRMVPSNLKLLDFKPVNEVAWPYVDGLHDDEGAIALARVSLGLPPTGLPHDATPELQTQGPAKEGKKRARDEERDNSDPYEGTAWAKRRRNSAGRGNNDDDVNAWNPSSIFDHTHTSSQPTWLLTAPYHNPGFQSTERDPVPHSSSVGHEEVPQCLTYMPRPLRLEPSVQFDGPSFDQAARPDASEESNFDNPHRSTQQLHIPYPLSSDSKVPPEESVPTTPMIDWAGLDEVPQTHLQIFGDAMYSIAPEAMLDGGDGLVSRPIREEEPTNAAQLGTPTSQLLIKKEEEDSEEVQLESIPWHTSVAMGAPDVDDELDEDVYLL
ncbi:MAG: hypothetical protein LQ338_004025 [Usnochroma carphineum]|nr:MAG: hypothetical protein LQ338_004025 [Usnochroma carphineum]